MPSLPPPAPFAARFSVWPDIRAALGAACNDYDIGGDVRLRIELALEELFANSIHHGYGAESDRPVWIAMRGAADGIEIDYQDAAPAFDPLGDTAPAPAGPLAEQACGGLGCLLVRQMASACRYRREGERNRVTLFFGQATTPA